MTEAEALEVLKQYAATHGAPVMQAAGQPHDIGAVLGERGKTYGPFEQHAEITQKLKDAVRAHCEQRRKTLAADMQEALDMIVHKIGRIVNGDPYHVDSWVDIAGYATLVADRLKGVSR